MEVMGRVCVLSVALWMSCGESPALWDVLGVISEKVEAKSLYKEGFC